jgi:hypothetical protein
MWQPQLIDGALASLRLRARDHNHTQIAAILKVRPKIAGRPLYGGPRLAPWPGHSPHTVAIGVESGVSNGTEG